MKKFVVACNRDRDSYQVPLALYEEGMLSSFVTDLYHPNPEWLPERFYVKRLSHRQDPGLPSKFVESSIYAVYLQTIAKRPIFPRLNKELGKRAAESAIRHDSDLFLYSLNAFESFTHPDLSRRQRGLFLFHPHFKLIDEILAADVDKYPEARTSYKMEHDANIDSQERETAEVELADFTVCASAFSKRSLLHLGIPSDRIHVVPYGTKPVQALAPGLLQSRESRECRFLFVGQGVQRKGIHHLLRAWSILSLPNASLTIVAWKLHPGFRELATDNVKFLEPLPRAELDALFASSHVFVMPSLVEGFGLVLGEALGAGCFTIASENTGLPDLEVPDDCGTVVKAGDVESIAMAIESAYELHERNYIDHNRIAEFAKTANWARFRRQLARTIRLRQIDAGER